MFSRLLPLLPLAPAVAVIVFAAGDAASAAAQGMGAARNEIEDVQVGEAGNLMRIALICRQDCRIAARAGAAFFVPGVETALDIDLEGRAKLADELVFKPGEGGSTLNINSSTDIMRASIKRCEINASPASCIDLEFGDRNAMTGEDSRAAALTLGGDHIGQSAPAQSAPTQSPPTMAAPTQSAPTKTAATQRAPAPDRKSASRRADAAPPNAPGLRDAPEAATLTFARFAPPERLDTPAIIKSAPRGAAPPTQASLTKREGGEDTRPVILTDRAEALIGENVDIATGAKEILSRSFGVAECEGARARLRTDAWALDAMVNVGFCDAIAGRLDDADGVFSRLLAYTPDNYQALVGRALIAAKSGDPRLARRYFQDALNSLPPMAESDRIVEAMAQL